ncbi:hypothetical protein CKAH01_06194 [Colletotrichum kahawae]|uniref:Uncharacterized protein n=1 Tax=Colletotrichum kahawae TaxID=34407 RepID=A0AAE0D437_COLKA|nr:hypothetical protein CKAH01_06194 [Colletotrichum kahawae]
MHPAETIVNTRRSPVQLPPAFLPSSGSHEHMKACQKQSNYTWPPLPPGAIASHLNRNPSAMAAAQSKETEHLSEDGKLQQSEARKQLSSSTNQRPNGPKYENRRQSIPGAAPFAEPACLGSGIRCRVVRDTAQLPLHTGESRLLLHALQSQAIVYGTLIDPRISDAPALREFIRCGLGTPTPSRPTRHG